MTAPLPTLGPYELVRELGRGAMGAVYLARRAGSAEAFAVKLVLHADADAIARFEREARLAGSLRHPNAIPVVDRGMAQGHRYLVMPFVEGETLRAVLRRGPLPVDAAVSLVLEIASAVEAAHRLGIVHRDLKPENVIVDPRGHAHVTDFGLARDLDPIRQRLTQSGVAIGTPLYMAPEQITGANEKVDARTDVHALGAILHECLAGRPAFFAPTLAEIAQKILASDAPRLESVAPDVPPDVAATVARALAADPDARFPSADAFAAALARGVVRDAPRARSSRVPAAVAIVVVVASGGALAERHRRSVAEEEQRLARERRERDGRDEEDRRREKLLAEAKAHLRRNATRDAAASARRLLDGRPPAELARPARLVLGLSLVREPATRDDGAKLLDELARDEASERSSGGNAGGAAPPQMNHGPGPLALLARAELALIASEGDDEDAARARKLSEEATSGIAAIAPEERAWVEAEARVVAARAIVRGWEPIASEPRYTDELAHPAIVPALEQRVNAALAHVDRAVELAPEDAHAWTARALVRYHGRELRLTAMSTPERPSDTSALTALAERDVERALALSRGSPVREALVLRARLHFRKGELAAADELLARALDDRPDLLEARVLRCFVKTRLGQDASDDVRALCEDDLRGTNGLVRHFAWLGIEDLIGPFRGAMLRFRDAFAMRARNEGRRWDEARFAPIPEAARALVAQGVALARQGRPLDEARRPLDEALEKTGGDPHVLLELARLHAGRDAADRALPLLARARQRAQDDALRDAIDLATIDALLRASEPPALGANANGRDQARALAEALAARHHDREDGVRVRALSYARRAAGDWRAARRLAAQAHRAEPLDVDVLRAFGFALLDGPEPEAAAALLVLHLAGACEAMADADVMAAQLLASSLVNVPSALVDTPAAFARQGDSFFSEQVAALGALCDRGRTWERYARRLVTVPGREVTYALAATLLRRASAAQPGTAHALVLDGWAALLDARPADEVARLWEDARRSDRAISIPGDALELLRSRDPARARAFEAR